VSRLVIDHRLIGQGNDRRRHLHRLETADFLQAATIAIVAEVPRARLRHAIAPYPTRSEVC